MNVLESGLNSKRANVGMYPELGILLAKYEREKLMDFIKLSTAKLIQACERHYYLEHVIVVYTYYDEFDQFEMILRKVSDVEIHYRTITFYLEEQPMQG